MPEATSPLEVVHTEGYDPSIDSQARLVYEHLDEALRAGGTDRRRVVMPTRYLVDVAGDQDAVNRVEGGYLGDHLPTSTTVELSRLATDPRLRLEVQAIAAI